MTSDLTHDGGDDHYYVAGYSVEDDPYVYPYGVLINLLNIQTPPPWVRLRLTLRRFASFSSRKSPSKAISR